MKLTKEVAEDLDLLIKDLVSDKPKVASVADIKYHLFPDKPEVYLISMFHHLNDHRPRLIFPKADPTPNGFWANDYLPAPISPINNLTTSRGTLEKVEYTNFFSVLTGLNPEPHQNSF